jgi:hypothetical protein
VARLLVINSTFSPAFRFRLARVSFLIAGKANASDAVSRSTSVRSERIWSVSSAAQL